jgi:hypothetical protein
MHRAAPSKKKEKFAMRESKRREYRSRGDCQRDELTPLQFDALSSSLFVGVSFSCVVLGAILMP